MLHWLSSSNHRVLHGKGHLYREWKHIFLLWCLYLRQPDADFTVHYAEDTQSHWLVSIFYHYIFFITPSFIPFMYSYDLDQCIFFFFSAFSLLIPFFPFFFAAPASWTFYLWPFGIIIIFPNFVCQSLQSSPLKSQPVVEIILPKFIVTYGRSRSSFISRRLGLLLNASSSNRSKRFSLCPCVLRAMPLDPGPSSGHWLRPHPPSPHQSSQTFSQQP